MTAREIFPEGALTLEQWQRVQELTTSLSPEQARWLSGYFAGLDAGLLRAGGGAPGSIVAQPAPGPATRTLTILYGTETGNCRDLAKGLAESARAQGLSPDLFDMADYKQRRLKD